MANATRRDTTQRSRSWQWFCIQLYIYSVNLELNNCFEFSGQGNLICCLQMCNEDRAWNGNFLPNKLKLILKSNDMIYDFWRFNKLHSVSTTMWSVVFKCKTINFNNIITLQKLLDADSFLYSFIYIDKLLFFLLLNDLKTDVVLFPTE